MNLSSNDTQRRDAEVDRIDLRESETSQHAGNNLPDTLKVRGRTVFYAGVLGGLKGSGF